MTILESLQGINDYPTKVAKLTTIATQRGLTLTDTVTAEILSSDAYKLATADVYAYLAIAPNISQGGVSISFSETQRKSFLSIANSLYAECDETTNNVTYGYKGSLL